MDIPLLQKQARQDLFSRHISRDPLKIIFNGKEYTARRSQPSMKRVMMASGFDQSLDCEMTIILEEGDDIPKSLQIIKESDSGKLYKILNVSSDFGTRCYTLTLGHSNSR